MPQFVGIFAMAFALLMALLEVPLVEHLKAGTDYRFRYRSEAFEEIAAVHDVELAHAHISQLADHMHNSRYQVPSPSRG